MDGVHHGLEKLALSLMENQCASSPPGGTNESSVPATNQWAQNWFCYSVWELCSTPQLCVRFLWSTEQTFIPFFSKNNFLHFLSSTGFCCYNPAIPPGLKLKSVSNWIQANIRPAHSGFPAWLWYSTVCQAKRHTFLPWNPHDFHLEKKKPFLFFFRKPE